MLPRPQHLKPAWEVSEFDCRCVERLRQRKCDVSTNLKLIAAVADTYTDQQWKQPFPVLGSGTIPMALYNDHDVNKVCCILEPGLQSDLPDTGPREIGRPCSGQPGFPCQDSGRTCGSTAQPFSCAPLPAALPSLHVQCLE